MRLRPSMPLLAAFAGMLLAGACRRGDPVPQAPFTGSPGPPISVTGAEKIVWDQAAIGATQLARYHFIVYVDDVPQELAGTTCDTTPATTPANGMFPCTAKLPKLSSGPHALQLAAEEMDGPRRRGARSGTLLLDVQPAQTSEK